MPWELHPIKGIPWNDQPPREVYSQSELNPSTPQSAPSEKSRIPVVPQGKEAFSKAKESPSSSHVLVHYNPSLSVILENDTQANMV